METRRRHVSALSPLCLHFFADDPGSGYKAETIIHSPMADLQIRQSDAMSGKPFQSCLVSYQDEIAILRSQKPPMSYARIADLLRQKYGLTVRRAAIGKFVKARSGGRKVYFFRREAAAKKRPFPGYPPQVPPTGDKPPKPTFEFKFSDRYNLTRLPPEEAAARRKKLEEEGH